MPTNIFHRSGCAASEVSSEFSAHQARLKIAGATWHPDTINPMLALRIIRANHWWSDFWNQYRSSQNLIVAHNEFNFN